MKKTAKRIVIAALLLILLVFATGCESLSDDEAIALIEDHLNRTYGGTFKVVSLHSETSGGNGVPFASTRYCVAAVTEVNSGFYFEATCNAKSKGVTDYYRQTILEKDLDRRLEAVFKDYPGLTLYYSRKTVEWGSRIQNWKPTDPGDLIETSPVLSADLYLSAEVPEEMAQEIYTLLQALKTEGISFSSLHVTNRLAEQFDSVMLISVGKNMTADWETIYECLAEMKRAPQQTTPGGENAS